MGRPPLRALLAAAIVGIVHVAVVVTILDRYGYPVFETVPRAATILLSGFPMGAVPALVMAYTRLVTPAAGFGLLAVAAVGAEVSTTSPSWSELNGYLVVDGPIYLWHYAHTWYVWLSLSLVVGVFKFAIRRRDDPGADRLRNLPGRSMDRRTNAWISVGFAGLFAIATTLLVLRQGISPVSFAVVVLVGGLLIAVVPLFGALSRGLRSPIALFLVVVPYVLLVEVFRTTDSPIAFLLFPFLALAFAIVGTIENRLRPTGGSGDGRITTSGNE